MPANVQQVPGSGVTPNGARQTWNQNDAALANEVNAHEATTIQAGAHGGTAGLGAVVNVNGTAPSLQIGPDASKPAAGTVGRVYIAQDTQRVYEDTGTAWQLVGVVAWGDVTGKPSLVLNAGGVPSIGYGADANKPAAGTAGRIYVASDTQRVYADSGTAWAYVGVVSWGDISGKPNLVLNAGSAPSVQYGADASKPAAGTAGRIYIASDTQRIYADSGSAWVYVGVVAWGDISGKPNLVSNAGSAPSIQYGLDASKPAAGTAGRIYVASDAPRIYVDSGTAWNLLGLPLGGGTLTGALVLAGDAVSALNPVSLQQFQARTMKDTVRVATTAALPANTYANGVLTASANGALPSIDGVSLAVGDRLYVINEATGANNGIYTVTSLGSATAAWSLTRATDADTSAKVVSGMRAHTGPEGTTQANTAFYLTTANPITLGTTALTFTKPPAGSVPPASTSVLGSVEVSASPVAAATPIALGQNDPYLFAEINGLALIWNSATSLTVDTGAAYVPGLNRLLDNPSQITLTGMTFTANTWYYLYLYSNAGTPAVEYSTVAPVSYKGPAKVKGPSATPDNTRRFLGAVLSDGSATPQLLNFQMTGGGSGVEVAYVGATGTAPYRVLSGAAVNSAYTSQSLAGICPPGITTAALLTLVTGTTAGLGSLTISLTTSGKIGQFNANVPAGSFMATTFWSPVLPATPSLYWMSAGVAGQLFYIDVNGYRFAR